MYIPIGIIIFILAWVYFTFKDEEEPQVPVRESRLTPLEEYNQSKDQW